MSGAVRVIYCKLQETMVARLEGWVAKLEGWVAQLEGWWLSW